MSRTVNSLLLELALIIDPTDKDGAVFTNSTIGANRGGRFEKQRLLDIYNTARLLIVNAGRTLLPKSVFTKMFSGLIIKKTNLAFTSGIATIPADFLEEISLCGIARFDGAIFVLNATPTVAGTGYLVGEHLIIATGGGIGEGTASILTTDGIAGAINVLNATPTAGGSGYFVGDVLAITTGGTLGTATVLTTDGLPGAVNVLEVVPSAGGTLYHVGDTLTIPCDFGTLKCTADVVTINEGTGAVLTVTKLTSGEGYTVASGNATTGGHGTGCELDITSIRLGAVLSVSKLASGSGYTTGAGKVTSGGHGSSCTLNITSIHAGTVLTVTKLTSGTGFWTGDWHVTGGHGYGCWLEITSIRLGAVLSVSKLASGTGYTTGAGKVTSGGHGSSCTLNITSVRLGAVTSVELVTAGRDYTTGAGKVTTGGSGTGCTLNITTVQSGIVVGSDIPILSVGDMQSVKDYESANNPFVFNLGSTFESLNGSTYVTNATLYVLRYIGFTNHTLANVILATTINEPINDEIHPKLIQLASMIANEQSGLDPMSLAVQIMKGGLNAK